MMSLVHPFVLLTVSRVNATLAAIPDPSEPTIVPLAIAVGGLLGTGIARMRHLPRERAHEVIENWAFAFGLFAIVSYVIALLLSSSMSV